MAHSYATEYPAGSSVPKEVVTFFEDFYRLSDTPGVDEQYVESFAPDATFVLASKASNGREEILPTRRGMWSAVSSRVHTIHQIYPFGDRNEYMLRGGVQYELKSGAKSDKDWAGYARLKEVDGKIKFAFYQVYLDTA